MSFAVKFASEERSKISGPEKLPPGCEHLTTQDELAGLAWATIPVYAALMLIGLGSQALLGVHWLVALLSYGLTAVLAFSTHVLGHCRIWPRCRQMGLLVSQEGKRSLRR
eukprot:m.89832 g.89832  ORF g.89832 m.89832 type:complete len:110 (-) comp18137_c0_seq1:27-356(-)